MSLTSIRHQRGFTLVEIMVVCLIVGILSSLAIFTIGRIKERTVRNLIMNNLRQFYDAKEFYFAETGSTQPASVVTLANEGYIRESLKNAVMSHTSLEAHLGWHYSFVTNRDIPTYAYRGSRPAAGAPPSDDLIYYPAPRS